VRFAQPGPSAVGADPLGIEPAGRAIIASPVGPIVAGAGQLALKPPTPPSLGLKLRR